MSINLAESRVTESIKEEPINSNNSRVITVDGSFREHIALTDEDEIINQDVSII